ncbi:pyridoxamine 5'-phosphate oxidase family protein [bacterium]|nr:pyridoxamine 5'-phosphate oxidase family protein [bacterium]
MRLWSLHPRYLDSKGLIALWRESLLAQSVILGKTKGYRHHPQLDRFIKTSEPARSIAAYLMQIYRESQKRGYRFDRAKISEKGTNKKIKVTIGQLEFELHHLKNKLKDRDQLKYNDILKIQTPEPNSIFIKTDGDIESWEKGDYMKKIPVSKTKGAVDVKERLKILNKAQKHAVLATDDEGQPYTSLVAFALTPDIDGVIFVTPKKTNKYQNILKNRKVSLMIDSRSNSEAGYMRSEAVTILGTAAPLKKGNKRDELSGVLIRKHPGLEEFITAASSALVLISFTELIHAGQFQRVTVLQ